MATGMGIDIPAQMIESMIQQVDAEACKFQLRELQGIQKQMDEYRKAGNKLPTDPAASQTALVESSLEATRQLFEKCKHEPASAQIVQTGLDVTTIALFSLLQQNPGAWLIAAGIDVVRRLGTVLQGLFNWKTPEQSAMERVDAEKAREAEALKMQKKMCLYVNYLDAVAAVEDVSRQQARVQECSMLDGDGVCTACQGLEVELARILKSLTAAAEPSQCAALRSEVLGAPPALSEAQQVFSGNRRNLLGEKPAPKQPAPRQLPDRVAELLAGIDKANPEVAGGYRKAWEAMRAVAGDSTSSCEQLSTAWTTFIGKFEPLFSAEEYKRCVELKKAIEAFQKRKNQDTEGVSASITQLLVNVQFSEFAAEKVASLEEAIESWDSQNKSIERVAAKGGNFSCPMILETLGRARSALKDIESPMNMCRVLRGREVPGTGMPMFGDRVNPVMQSNQMFIRTRGSEGTRLEVSCNAMSEVVSRAFTERSRFQRNAGLVNQRCGSGHRIEWPNTL